MEPKLMSEELEQFKSKYRATVSEGRMRYTIPKKFSISQTQDWDMNFDVEYGVQIDMSQRDFEHLVHMEKHFYDTMRRSDEYMGAHGRYIVKQYEREQRIRASNPAARIAYEKYLNIMRMVDGGNYYD
jgi:hypothetical protein